MTHALNVAFQFLIGVDGNILGKIIITLDGSNTLVIFMSAKVNNIIDKKIYHFFNSF